MGLKGQCVIIKYIVDVCLTKDISSWKMLVKRLPVNIHNFCRRYLVMSLANDGRFQVLVRACYVVNCKVSFMFSITVPVY